MTSRQPHRDPGTNLPIFILGITERSGTNFLFHLLCLHPDIDPGGPIWENYLTLHLEKLIHFADAVYGEWNPEWKVSETLGSTDVLLEDLGNGVINFLNRQKHLNPLLRTEKEDAAAPAPRDREVSPRRLLTKNPSVQNLQHFFRLFPNAPAIILVRDGRAVVESAVKTFKLTYEKAMHKWTVGGENILRFLDQPLAKKSPVLLVKYEDLFQNTEAELRRIFAFLNLSPEPYDFSAAKSLPVFGSSELQKGGEGVHWRGVEKKAGFDPMHRWEKWSPSLQDRFLWIGGDVLHKLGYSSPSPSTGPFWHSLRNSALDLYWRLRRRVRRR